jgi:hypothetical protein
VGPPRDVHAVARRFLPSKQGHLLPIRLPALIATGSLLLASHSAAAQQTFRDPSHGFSLQLPAQWRAMPDSVVRRISVLASQAGGAPVRYVAGFELREESGWGEFPYVLIQFAETPPVSEEAFVRFLTGAPGRQQLDRAAKRVQGSLSMQEVALREPYWEAQEHVLWLPSHSDTGRGLTIEALSAFHLSRRGFVAVHYYDTQPGDLRGTLLPVVRSLRFDPGAEYQPPAQSTPAWSRGVVTAAIIGALVGVLLGGLAMWRKRAA